MEKSTLKRHADTTVVHTDFIQVYVTLPDGEVFYQTPRFELDGLMDKLLFKLNFIRPVIIEQEIKSRNQTLGYLSMVYLNTNIYTYINAFFIIITGLVAIYYRRKVTIKEQEAEKEQQYRQLLEDVVDNMTSELQQKDTTLNTTNEALQDSMDKLRGAQSQLIETEKLASLGALVAGVAHEINTPLGIGVTSITYLQEQLQNVTEKYNNQAIKRSDLEKYFNTSGEAIDISLTNLKRAAELIQSFKEIAVDRSSENLRTIQLKDYLQHTLLSLGPQFKRTNHTVEIHGTDVRITSYPGTIAQIITNLILNTLTHGFENVDAGHVDITVNQPSADQITIVYEDNGKGMTEETVKRLYDPFFTTKRGKGGSGLGMHIVYNLVTRKLSGSIACDSSPGQGTKITITIPITSA
ncbi:MAG: sensor histidine kinase [Desulfovibrio sp.]